MHKPTVLTSVPTMINAMVSAPAEERRDLASLRMLFSAGEALPEELYNRWKKAYGVEIYDGIGSAELFHIYCTNRPGDVKPGTLGKLVEGYEARIARPDGSDAPAGEVGTLWVRGDSAAVYYWRDHEKSKQVLRGDWVVSGDLFSRDAQGYFRYEGRADDMLKVGGVWVAPLEIEGCLLEHAAVGECCVLGYEDDGLVKPLALVVPARGATPGSDLAVQLQEHVKKKLNPYKYPRKVVFRAAPLPKNDRGKVDRKALKEALAKGEIA
jgi:acyl-coenzyme A synthetase/AMP-(fatty) acid ligase